MKLSDIKGKKVAIHCDNPDLAEKVFDIFRYISETDHIYSAAASLIEDAVLTKFGYGLPFKIATNL